MNLHGGDIYGVAQELDIPIAECLDFSANLNPLGIPPRVWQAMLAGLNDSGCYPDPKSMALSKALTDVYKVPTEYIVVGNGAADLIFRFVYALRPAHALLIVPTFLEYREALNMTDTKISYYRCLDNHNVDLTINDDLLDQISADLDLIFFCNPNNPTGILTDKELLLRIVTRARELKIKVVIDECFLDFTGLEQQYSLVDILADYPNVLLLKSFTKMFSIPGIRIGYGFCADPELLSKVRAAGQSWPVNTVASAAGIAALKEQQFVQQTVLYIKIEREFLQQQLTALGITVYPGTANFLLLQIPGMTSLYQQLLKYRIMIRRCSNYDDLDDCYYRIAVRSRSENIRLCRAIEEILNNTIVRR